MICLKEDEKKFNMEVNSKVNNNSELFKLFILKECLKEDEEKFNMEVNSVIELIHSESFTLFILLVFAYHHLFNILIRVLFHEIIFQCRVA